MRQLNNALGDVLAGFDEDVNNGEENEEDLVIDESPRKSLKTKNSPIKLKLNVAAPEVDSKSKTKALSSTPRAVMEDLKMTKVHQVVSKTFSQYFDQNISSQTSSSVNSRAFDRCL